MTKEGILLHSSGWAGPLQNRSRSRLEERSRQQLRESLAALEMPVSRISKGCGAWRVLACRLYLALEVVRSLAMVRRSAVSVSAAAQQIKKTSNAPKPVLKLWIREIDRVVRVVRKARVEAFA